MAKSIIFSGQFNLGERVTELQKRTVKDALRMRGDLAILVDDIGFAQKVEAYIHSGIAGVVASYEERLEDCTSGCVRAQLPALSSIAEVIDEEQYEDAIMLLEGWMPALLFAMKTATDFDSPTYARLRGELDRVAREYIIPHLREIVISHYDFDWDDRDLKKYSERELRRTVADRTTSRKLTSGLRELSWRRQLPEFRAIGKAKYIGPEMVVNHQGIPVCRGIMLALYEKLAMEGYDRVVQLSPENQRTAIERAETAYRSIEDSLAQTRGRPLMFEDRFY